LATKKITELAEATTLTADDLLVCVDAPGGSATTKKITQLNVATSILGKGTFVNADLSTGVLTVTHNLALSAPYMVLVKVFNNSNVEIIPDTLTGFANSFTITLTSYGTITGTWGYVYWKA
jgi:hypothetical protein